MERLIAIALCISAMSMFLSCAAIWPHSQQGLERARNTFLWAMFAFAAVGMATIAYRKMEQRRHRVVSPSEFVSTPRRSVIGAQPRAIPGPVPRSAPRRDRLMLQPQSGVAVNPRANLPANRRASFDPNTSHVYQARYPN